MLGLSVPALFVRVMPVFTWYAAFLAGGGVAAGAAAGWWMFVWTATSVVLLQQSVIFRYYKLSHANPWLAPTYPFGALLSLGMLLNAMTKVIGMSTTTWRGTTYLGNEIALEQATDAAGSS